MVQLIDLIFTLFNLAILTRVILSVLIPIMGGRPHPVLISLYNAVAQLTEPILAPIRRILPTVGMLDFSPMVAIILMIVIREFLVRLLTA